MRQLKRYCAAWTRFRRSRGFGIHSPSAYKLVTQVLGERLPYSAYDELHALRKGLQTIGEQDLISDHDAQLLFRIVNHFTPQNILIVGVDSALTVAAMLMPSRKANVYANGDSDRLDHIVRQIDDNAECILPYAELRIALFDYMAAFLDQPKRPFVLINALPDPERATLMQRVLDEWLAEDETVVIIRNIHRDAAMQRLWLAAKQVMPHGHSYTNDKTAILVARQGIPRQHFDLWL